MFDLSQIMAANGGELPRLAGGATDKVILREDFKAAENLAPTATELEKGETGGQFKLVELNEESQLVLAATGSANAFPLIDATNKGEWSTIAMLGIAKVKCGGTIKAGKRVGAMAGGLAQEFAAKQFVVGTALEKGESGQIISIFLTGLVKTSE